MDPHFKGEVDKMTKADYSHIFLLLDRSGSMHGLERDVVGGTNKFLQEQRDLPGHCTITIAQFDNQYDTLREFEDLKKVKDLARHDFQPRGSTALLDAITRIVNETGERLSDMKEEDRPSKVIGVIYTDGQENASLNATADTVASLIKQQREVYSWEFVYLGANQDSFAIAHAYGMNAQLAQNFAATSQGLAGATAYASNTVKSLRGS